MPASSRAFCTRQHGCTSSFSHMLGQRWSRTCATGSYDTAVRALLFHGPGDLRLEEVPRPEPGPGEVLVQIEVALTDGTDLKTYRRGHPVLLTETHAPFGHELCGIVDGRRVVPANSAPCGV